MEVNTKPTNRKRSAEQANISQSDNLPPKRIKLSSSIQNNTSCFIDAQPSKFNKDCLKMNIEKTINEFESYPSVMTSKKMNYLLNKFYIASNTRMHYRDHFYDQKPFYERICTFIDDENNICFMTDDYRKEVLVTGYKNYFKPYECSIEIYHNPPALSERINEIHFDFLGKYKFSIHRTYVLILRVPFQKFVERYTNSFEEYVFNAAKIFQNNASEFLHSCHQPKTFLHIFADFFDDDANFDPNSVLSKQNYFDLFQVYHKKYPRAETCLYSIFITLYELYDMNIRMKLIKESIQNSWNKFRSKLDYFEPTIAETIVQFVNFEVSEPTDFMKFIEDQKLKSKNNVTMFKANHYVGRYTHLYEKQLFRDMKCFCLNPFEWGFLNKKELDKFGDESEIDYWFG